MENNNNYSVADSGDSSPRSRDAENNTISFIDEPPPPSAPATTTIAATATATNKVKFMCSYGGRIQPRPHDNQLTYVGGDTKILAVDRHIGFPALAAKLSSIAGADVCFKYQLPGEDLDALISVTNDEDQDHMMVEYDRLCRSSPRPTRLRLILFPLPNTAATTTNNNYNNAPPLPPPSAVTKPEPQWFVDALNSVQLPEPPSSPQLPPPPVAALNPDFLFGLDKPRSAVFADPAPAAPTVPDFAAGGSDGASHAVRETEFVRQVQELQRLHLGSNNEQPPPHQRKNSEENGRVSGVEFYTQKNPEKSVHSGPVHVSGPVPVPVQGSLLHKHVGCGGGYSMPVSGTGVEPAPVYLIQTPSGIYQAVRPVGPGPVYLIQTPAAVSHPAQKVGYGGSEVGATAERGYSQIAYAVRPQAAAAPGGDGWN